jgi:hypothetical protein
MKEHEKNQLTIIVEKTTQIDTSVTARRSKSGGFFDDEQEVTEVTEISVDAEKLKAKMSSFIKLVTVVVSESVVSESQEAVDKKSGMQLEELKLIVEISGEGEFKILGTGAKAGGKGALELVFKRCI